MNLSLGPSGERPSPYRGEALNLQARLCSRESCGCFVKVIIGSMNSDGVSNFKYEKYT